MLNFYRMFLDSTTAIGGVLIPASRYFDNISEVVEFVNTWVDTYFDIEESDKLEVYRIPRVYNHTTKSEELAHISLDTFYHRGHSRTDDQNILYFISKQDRGPFAYNKTQFRHFLSNTTHFQLIYRLDNSVPTTSVGTFDCYHWVIYQEFDFTQRNLLIASLQATRTYWDAEYSIRNFWPRYMWIHLLCMVLSIVSLILNLKYIYDIFKSYNSVGVSVLAFRSKTNIASTDFLPDFVTKRNSNAKLKAKRTCQVVQKQSSLTLTSLIFRTIQTLHKTKSKEQEAT